MGSDAGEHTAESMTEPDSSADAAEPVALDGASDAPVAAPPANGSLRVTAVVAVIVLALDQLTKHWALNELGDGRSRHVIGTLQWNLTFNSGMAFSRAQGIGPYIGVLALIVIVVMLLSVRRSNGRAAAIAVGLVVGGALGNLTDRLLRERGWLRGRVVDFIDLQWWPIFNIADMGVSIGGVLIVLGALLESKRAPR